MKHRSYTLIKGVIVFLPMVGGFFANVAICAMAILVVAMAVLRYGFNWTPGWGDSVNAYLVVFTVFIGAAHTFQQGKHIRILFLYKTLPRNVRPLVDALSGILALFYTGYLIYSTTDIAMMSLRLQARTPDGLILFPLQIWIPVGLCLLFITVSAFTVERFITWVRSLTGRSETKGSIFPNNDSG